MALAGVSVASDSGSGRWSPVQWDPDQSLLGADISVLYQQVNSALTCKSLPVCRRPSLLQPARCLRAAGLAAAIHPGTWSE